MTSTSRATVECAHLERSDRPSSAKCDPPLRAELRLGGASAVERSRWRIRTRLERELTFASPCASRSHPARRDRPVPGLAAGTSIVVRQVLARDVCRSPPGARQCGADDQNAARHGSSARAPLRAHEYHRETSRGEAAAAFQSEPVDAPENGAQGANLCSTVARNVTL